MKHNMLFYPAERNIARSEFWVYFLNWDIHFQVGGDVWEQKTFAWDVYKYLTLCYQSLFSLWSRVMSIIFYIQYSIKKLYDQTSNN